MMQMSNVRVLDRAEAPEKPTSPKPLRNLVLAVAIGLLAGIGLAFLVEALDTTITTREHIEERLAIPFLGIIPTIERDKSEHGTDLFVHEHPQSAAAECLRSIRANLLFMSPEKALRTILVTSSSPGEGKTTAAILLAEIMADAGHRVLLIDADMRRPRVHKVFRLAVESGLSSLILGDGRLDSVTRATNIKNVDVLPVGPIPPNPTELIHTAAFKAILAAAAERYDRVIIDSPPAGVVADAVVISTQVDGTLFVLRAGETSRDAALRSVRALADVNARVFGAVLNALDIQRERYGRHYYYGYSGPTEPGVAS
jgi:capsular exopolysaccharide synthesis family protein